MHPEVIEACLILLSTFGGIAGIIAANGWAKAEQRRAEGKAPQIAPDSILTELQTLKQQVHEMQSTGHEFDISFDSALSRLEDRVNRLETKTIVGQTQAPETHLYNGRQ